MPERCRLCTSNDREGLVEQLAADLWSRHQESEVMGPWEEAGLYWQTAMRNFARSAVEMLEGAH